MLQLLPKPAAAYSLYLVKHHLQLPDQSEGVQEATATIWCQLSHHHHSDSARHWTTWCWKEEVSTGCKLCNMNYIFLSVGNLTVKNECLDSCRKITLLFSTWSWNNHLFHFQTNKQKENKLTFALLNVLVQTLSTGFNLKTTCLHIHQVGLHQKRTMVNISIFSFLRSCLRSCLQCVHWLKELSLVYVSYDVCSACV